MRDKTITVGHVMTTPVITVTPNDSMTKVQELFSTYNLHHLPVVDGNKVVGIISYTDYLKLLHGFTLFKTEKSEAYNKAILESLLVGEVMTKQVATLRAEDTLECAVGIFRENLFHALPVVSHSGQQLIGIITTFDLINYAFSNPALLGNEIF